jgi:hypothetical protein
MNWKQPLLIVFIILAAIPADSIAQPPTQSRELQFIQLDEFEIGIDNDPKWIWTTRHHDDITEFSAATPKYYYPPALLNVQYFKNVQVPKDELFATAKVTIQQAQQNFNGSKPLITNLRKVSYGELQGYEAVFEAKVDGVLHDIKLLVATNNDGNMLTLLAYTLPGKLPHVQPALKRAWDHIHFRKSLAQSNN